MSTLRIDNQQARRLWLAVNGLIPDATSVDGLIRENTLLAPMAMASRIVRELGLVQLDPLSPLARAHEHILWTRCNRLRPRHFERLLEERKVFEHFSHDACILPIETWPCWQRQFERRAAAMERGSWGCAMPDTSVREKVLRRIERDGPLCSRDFEDRSRPPSGAWTKPPHKLALDWLWMSGQLAVTHRRRFIKHYDLVERVIPADVRERKVEPSAQYDWLCRQALHRLGSATTSQLQHFWDVLTQDEVKQWLAEHSDAWQSIAVEANDGKYISAIAERGLEDRIERLGSAPKRLRIINPFDPLVRDRKRLNALFGFDFRIEIYVPPDKRRFGYYVYPMLEGTRFIGRIELKAEREHDRLYIKGLWLEPGVRLGQQRRDRLQAELVRIARLGDVSDIGAIPSV